MNITKRVTQLVFAVLLVMGASACTGKPENVFPQQPFTLEPYLGKWYEIARLNHSFERGLSRVTANYTLREDGGVDVLNRGYNAEDKIWKDAEGKAYFKDDKNVGWLKVSFFGPFYGSYIVMETDYTDYAYVSGPDTEYLWLLSRTPTQSPERVDDFKRYAQKRGFNTSGLIMVDQSSIVP